MTEKFAEKLLKLGFEKKLDTLYYYDCENRLYAISNRWTIFIYFENDKYFLSDNGDLVESFDAPDIDIYYMIEEIKKEISKFGCYLDVSRIVMETNESDFEKDIWQFYRAVKRIDELYREVISLDINIREATKDDAEDYLKLINLVWRDSYKNIFPEEVFLEKEQTIQKKINEFDKYYYNDDKVITYVAECRGKIVGILWGKMDSEHSYFCEKGYADLMALYINPYYQGMGFGTKLKDAFINWARKNGAKRFIVGVLKDNKKARKIYEYWGGTLSEYSQQFIKLDKGYDEVFYEFDL